MALGPSHYSLNLSSPAGSKGRKHPEHFATVEFGHSALRDECIDKSWYILDLLNANEHGDKFEGRLTYIDQRGVEVEF